MSGNNPSSIESWDEAVGKMIVVDALPTISLQPTQRSPSQVSNIPGPGRPVQEGLFRKKAHDAMVLRGESSQTRPTQHFIREVYNDPQQADVDFNSLRWTSVMNFIFLEGTYNNRTPPFWTQITDITCPSSEFVKVDKVVGIISTLTPNGFGDMLVTLKDQSGKIEGTMHQNIFRNEENRLAISVGAVVILRNVTVCRFARKYKYLNIVARNIVKIVGVTSMVTDYEPVKTRNDGDEFLIVPDSDEDE